MRPKLDMVKRVWSVVGNGVDAGGGGGEGWIESSFLYTYIYIFYHFTLIGFIVLPIDLYYNFPLSMHVVFATERLSNKKISSLILLHLMNNYFW